MPELCKKGKLKFTPFEVYYFKAWRDSGDGERINRELRIEIRVSLGKNPEPSAAILDSQSVKATEARGSRGYDAGKKVNGIKRHLLVDTLGMVLAVLVLTADIQDRDGWSAPVVGKDQKQVSASSENLGRWWLCWCVD